MSRTDDVCTNFSNNFDEQLDHENNETLTASRAHTKFGADFSTNSRSRSRLASSSALTKAAGIMFDDVKEKAFCSFPDA